MAIDLLNRFVTGKVNTPSSVNANPAAVLDSAQAEKIIRSIYALKTGDTLQGELLAAKGTDISLLLGNTVTLNAKLNKELHLTPGQLMSFTVTANKNGKLSLAPLFANTGMEQNAMKALDAAGIPVTEKTLAMAEELMKQGMPINKAVLSEVYRQMGMHPQAEIMDLVTLHRMNLPVTEDSIAMMRLYQTNQQQLFSDFEGLSAELTNLLYEMKAQGQTEAAVLFYGIQEIFSAQGTSGMEEIIPEQIIEKTGANLETKFPLQAELSNTNELPVSMRTEDGMVFIKENGAETIEVPQAETARIEPVLLPEQTEELRELSKLFYKETVSTSDTKAAFGETLLSLLKEQFLMDPKSITSSEYVKEFYEKLDTQLEQLHHLLKSVGKEESTLARTTATIKSNIQFMNQINAWYHYVQLPIKMDQKQAKGDLYVYKRKQAKTGDDGKLTALLHLSLPTLGNMDVFLTLEQQKLSTRFCMEKEEMIDFIEEHIEELNLRLRKKGYQVQTNVAAAAKEEKTVIENLLSSQASIPVLNSQSFDARC